MSERVTAEGIAEPKGWRMDNAELTKKVAEMEKRIMSLEEKAKKFLSIIIQMKTLC